jgi:hypothetical protein
MNTQKDLNKSIEKIIKLRIEDIVLKSNLDEKIGNQIIDINEGISKEIKIKKYKKDKKDIPKEDKILNEYTLYIKDVTEIIKEKNNLNYLPNNIVNKIKKSKDKSAKDKFKDFSIIWNELDKEIKDNYKQLCKNKDFTNNKYSETVVKGQTPKTPRKRKSKESLKELHV